MHTDILVYNTEDDVHNFNEALEKVNEHMKSNCISQKNLAEYRTDIQEYTRASYRYQDINEERYTFIISYWMPDTIDEVKLKGGE
jgi:hypothetical protein